MIIKVAEWRKMSKVEKIQLLASIADISLLFRKNRKPTHRG